MWIFGYGSLIWRPDFPYVASQVGWIAGWSRRLWQGSTDHRGVPGAPGRVATVVPAAGERCWGRAFEIAPEEVERVLAQLDVREQGGYVRSEVEVWSGEGVVGCRALMYHATPENAEWLGEASAEAIARQVIGAVGPSGRNVEYVRRLGEALRGMGVVDEHVEEVMRAMDNLAQRV